MKTKINNIIVRKHKLITKKLEKRFKQIGSQEKNLNPIVIARYFFPLGNQIWYATEYSSKNRVFFGYVSLGLGCDEWGHFSLKNLENYDKQGFHIERDLYFKEAPINECLKIDGLL